MNKNLVIFDGSNFYHKAKKLAPDIHLTNFNYRKLAETLTGSAENDIEYCIGEIKRDSNNFKSKQMYNGQMALFNTLRRQKVVVKKGFMMKINNVFHEKGVDVRIATDIVRGALKGEYDCFYVISSDSDILPAIEAAIDVGKKVVYVAFEKSVVSKALAINCSETIFITKSTIQVCAQLEKSMTSKDVTDLYIKLDNLGIEIWIDGGWNVDALLGRQTRPHKDLDIAIEWKDVPKLRELLAEQGYKQIKADSQWNFVLGDDNSHEIDVHAFVFDDKGNIVEGIMYPAASLTGTGVIDSQKVRCVSAESVVAFHSGYELTDVDFKDVFALCEKFGMDLPEEYARFKKSG